MGFLVFYQNRRNFYEESMCNLLFCQVDFTKNKKIDIFLHFLTHFRLHKEKKCLYLQRHNHCKVVRHYIMKKRH